MKSSRAQLRRIEFDLPFAAEANMESQIHPSGKFLYTPEEKVNYMAKISNALSDYKGYFDQAMCIRMTVLFVCHRPASAPHYIKPGVWNTMSEFYKATRPDIDNYLKPIQDGMSNHIIRRVKHKRTGDLIKVIRGAGIIDDDACIVSLRADKIYAQKGDNTPRIEIKLEEVSPFYVRR